MKTISKLIFTAVLGFSALGFQAKAEDFPEAIKPLMQKYTCFACHKVDARLVGPAYQDVAKTQNSVNLRDSSDKDHWWLKCDGEYPENQSLFWNSLNNR